MSASAVPLTAAPSLAGASKRRSKFDVGVTFAAELDSVAAVYHKYFRNEVKCKVTRARFLDASAAASASAPPSPASSAPVPLVDAASPPSWHGCDTLILPLTSSFGLVGTASPLLSAIVAAHLDDRFEQRLQDVLARKYLGELPLGTALVLRNERRDSALRYVVVTALARVLTVRGDSMAWLDPGTHSSASVHRCLCSRALQPRSTPTTRTLRCAVRCSPW